MALALGKTVKQLLAEVDSAELGEWRAYYSIEPFGETIADQRHGISTATLANINRDAKRRPEPYAATDFIYWHPVHREEPRPPDPKVQSARIKDLLRIASANANKQLGP